MSSATSQKLPGEASPTVPTFSYAQAAKGRSPSVPSLLSSGKNPSETMNNAVRSTSVPSSKDAPVIPVNSPVLEPSSDFHEEDHPKDDNHKDSNSSDLEVTPKNTASLVQSNSLAQPQPAASTPSSPSFGTASTSTLPKEDELSSTANGSSDSNWDKNSQGSLNGSKPGEKVEDNKAHNSALCWNDESAPSALLKEAPPPAVNFWQHRKEINEAKAKTRHPTGPQAPKLTTEFGGSGNTSNLPKVSDSGVDLKKQENKKKAKSSSPYVEEKSTPGNNKEGNKTGEGRMKSIEGMLKYTLCLDSLMLTTRSIGQGFLSRLKNARHREDDVCGDCSATSW